MKRSLKPLILAALVLAVGRSALRIDGKRVYALVSDYRTEALNYYGVFALEAVPRTCREGAEAHLYGWPGEKAHVITCYHAGDFFSPDLKVLTDRGMEDFAIALEDGTILATSGDWYRACVEAVRPPNN